MKATKTPGPNSLKFLVLSAKGWGTGSALRAYYIAGALKKRGHSVVFIRPLPTLPGWLDMAVSTFYYAFRSLFIRSDAALAVKPYPMVVPALFIQRLKGAKVIIDVDDLDYAYSRGPFKTFHQWLQKPWPKWADLATYHNPKLREPIAGFFQVAPRNTLVLPQGVDRTIFNLSPVDPGDLPPGAAGLAARKNRGPLLVFTAHLNVACDLGPVLESLKSVLVSKPGAVLLVAGGGPDQGKFERMASDLGVAPSVLFTGPITPRQVAACMKVSDAALVYYSATPANEHRASMKLREALACGCRVAATDVGEAAQWKNVLHLSRPEPAAFSRAVLKALRSKKNTPASLLLVKKWDWTECVGPLERELLKR